MKRQELKGKIVAACGSEGAFAKAIGVSLQTVSNAVGGKTVPHKSSWDKWAEALKIDRAALITLFFGE